MANLIYALAVPFTCGVAVQRLLAILDAVWTWRKFDAATKAWLSALISFVCGLAVAFGGYIRILEAIATVLMKPGSSRFSPETTASAQFIDIVATALIVSAGTEGFNTIIKFLGYAKEQQKAKAAERTNAATQGKTDALKVLHS